MKSFVCLGLFLLLSLAHSRIRHGSSYQSIESPGGEGKELSSSKEERASDWTIWKETTTAFGRRRLIAGMMAALGKHAPA